MYKIVLLVVLFALSVFASDLKFVDGYVKGHTEVFGDSTIDPMTKDLNVNLSMDESIESLRGSISFDVKSFVSDNDSRDEHMYESLKADEFSNIKVDIKNITFGEKNYIITADLTLDGVTKEIKSIASISKDANGIITLDGKFYILMSDYGITPPTMFFLTVRDMVNVTYNINLRK